MIVPIDCLGFLLISIQPDRELDTISTAINFLMFIIKFLSIGSFLVHRNFHVGLVAPNLHINEGAGTSSLKRIFSALALLDADQDFLISGSQQKKGFSDTLISVNLDTLEVSQMNGRSRMRYQMPVGRGGVS